MMDVAVAAAVFPVILLAELPDKTMVASLVLATRGRATAVWLGAAAAFAVHVAIATTAGTVVARLLPHRITEAIVAVMFAAGAVLAGAAAWRERGRAGDPPAPAASTRPGRTALTALVVVFAAEWGDLTQILTANLAARYHAPLAVGTGAVLALWSAAAIAVTGGQRLARLVRPVVIRAATVVVLAGLAAYSAWLALA